MSYREQRQALQESLNILQVEGFLYELENLGIIYQAILTIIPGWIWENPWLWQVQDIMCRQQFLEALQRLSASLRQLQPALACLRLAALQRFLRELEEEGEGAEWWPDPLDHIVAALQQLGPGELMSHLQHLTQVLREVRPAGGFRALATHPGVVARLGTSNFLKFLANLEEAADDNFLDAEIAQQLHFLRDFAHRDAVVEKPEP